MLQVAFKKLRWEHKPLNFRNNTGVLQNIKRVLFKAPKNKYLKGNSPEWFIWLNDYIQNFYRP